MKNYIPVLIYDPVTHKRLLSPGEEPHIPYDEAAFDLTEVGRRRRECMALHDVYHDDPMNPHVLKYWADKGLKKELFDAGHDDAKYAYSVFTPLDMDWGKKYALIYFSHGGGVTIEMAETYGFNTLAAVEKYIIVYPANGGRSNDEVDTEFERVTEELRKKGYPIDWERVYCVGFSSGSEASACAACTYPEKVAAIGVLPGGQPFKDLLFYTGKEYYETTKGMRIPGIFIGGTVDHANYPAPWIIENPPKDYRIENLNIWMREIGQIKNYRELTREGIEDLLRNSDNPVEKEFGLKFDREFTFHVQELDWLGGEYFGADGAPVMQFVRAIGVPHVVWESQANITWHFLKHFRRDLETGESIYDPVACWGER